MNSLYLIDPEETEDNNEEKVEREEDDYERGNDEEDDDDDDDESDDDVHITIGDIKAGPAAYTGFNVKRGAAGTAAQGMGEKSKVDAR